MTMMRHGGERRRERIGGGVWGSPGLGGDFFDCFGDFDSPRAEASAVEVPMMTMMYYSWGGKVVEVGRVGGGGSDETRMEEDKKAK